MELFTNQVLAGIATGAIYACMALAVVMIYEAIDHLNFAQGEMAMFSTFIAWQFMEWGTSYWVAFILSVIISFIGANVLQNCTTRFNVSSSQVRSWKESLFAAEAGGDIAYAEVRKTVLDPTHAFAGWDTSGPKRISPVTTFGANNLVTNTVVDSFYTDPAGNPWFRARSRGTAPVLGLTRTGMDDRMGAGARGDSLLRKIDFRTDHFLATYGPNGDGTGQTVVAVVNPQITRRIEQISAPITPFET